MAKQTRKAKTRNQAGDALQSLLNDQTEARLQREINISRNEADESSSSFSGGQSSGTISPAGSRAVNESSGARKPPSMKETKAQLVKRMEKLLSEMNRLEAGLEQKDLEKERIEKDMKELASELKNIRSENDALGQELGAKDEAITASLKKQQELEKKVQDLEKQSRDLSHEVQKKEQLLSDLKKEKQELQARVYEMDKRIQEFSSLEDDFKTKLSEKDNEIYSLNQKILKLQQDNKNIQKQVSARNKEDEIQSKKMGAEDWREKANSLWDGKGYTAPQKAISYLSAALELKADWPEALNDRGLAYLDDYQLDNSLEDFTTAIALKVDFAEAYHNRGVVLLKTGKKFAAKKDFQIAASHGLWLGMNALSAPPKGPGFFERLKQLLVSQREVK